MRQSKLLGEAERQLDEGLSHGEIQVVIKRRNLPGLGGFWTREKALRELIG